MARMIPPIGTRGQYTLGAPFTASLGTIYSCSAIRKFIDLENMGTPVFETYYAPMGLSRSEYSRDRGNDEVIVTLTSASAAPIYVPSSYITSYPNQSYRNYHHVVMSASLGPLPDYIDLSFAQQQMKNVVSDVIGVETTVHLSAAPMTDSVSPADHESLEAARAAAINNRTTDYARKLDQDQKIQRLESRLAVAEEILRANGLIPE